MSHPCVRSWCGTMADFPWCIVQGNELFGQRKWAEAAEKYRAVALLAGP